MSHPTRRNSIQKIEAVNEQITCLYGESKVKVCQREETILESKVTDKKMVIVEKQLTNYELEIEESKFIKENIALEMVDLMQELDDERKQRKERWRAIKLACLMYKEKLDIHIRITEFEDHDCVQFTFLHHKNPNKDTYYVNLFNYKNYWKVGQIVPLLKPTHHDDLRAAIDFTKPLDVLDVIAFLCKLRRVFLKHYSKD